MLAFVGDEAVGYKVGYRESATTFYSAKGGVLDAWRRMGVAKALLVRMEAEARRMGRLRRNFQGYTDDTAPVLVGLGASAISRFPLGYAQNAPATSAYVAAVRAGKFPVTRGHVFAGEDRMRARLIEAVMCDLRIDAAEILSAFDVTETELFALFRSAAAAFEGKLLVSDAGLAVPEEMRPLVRLIARHFDAYDLSRAGHSAAI